MTPLTTKQREVLEFLRLQDQPFSTDKLIGWGLSTHTFNALVRRGWARPVIGGWRMVNQKREQP